MTSAMNRPMPARLLPWNHPKTLLDWCRPEWIVLATGIPVLVAYWIVPAAAFAGEYGAAKMLTAPWPLLYMLALLMLAAIAARLGFRAADQLIISSSASVRRLILPDWYLNAGLAASLAGYVVWIALGISRSGGFSPLLQTYLAQPYFVKRVILDTIPGVTTLTQVAVLALPLLLLYRGAHTGVMQKIMVALLLLAALTRAFLASERLALLELVIPLAVLRWCKAKLSLRQLLMVAAASVGLLVLFFVANEMRRTFVYHPTPSPVLDGVLRFGGYYLTSLNNGIWAILHLPFNNPFYWTLRPLWEFPGIPDDLYTRLTGLQPFDAASLLIAYPLNPAFSTISAMGVWVVDFGLLGAPVAAAAFGLISGCIYRLARSSPIFLVLYSVWLVGLLNITRSYYFTSTRLFPALLFWFGALLLLELTRKLGSSGVQPATL